MSMEINGSYSHFGTDYAEGVKEKQAAKRAEEAKETNKGINDIKVSGQVSEPQDEYISSEKSGTKPSGLYRVGQDENGNRKIYFEDPNQSPHSNEADAAEGKEQPEISRGSSGRDGDGREPKAGMDHPEKSEEKCVGNTDKVDREIRELKEKKKQLEQQIRSASKDERKIRKLEEKLAQVENELSRKDNDTYRRQNSSFRNV